MAVKCLVLGYHVAHYKPMANNSGTQLPGHVYFPTRVVVVEAHKRSKKSGDYDFRLVRDADLEGTEPVTALFATLPNDGGEICAVPPTSVLSQDEPFEHSKLLGEWARAVYLFLKAGNFDDAARREWAR